MVCYLLPSMEMCSVRQPPYIRSFSVCRDNGLHSLFLTSLEDFISDENAEIGLHNISLHHLLITMHGSCSGVLILETNSAIFSLMSTISKFMIVEPGALGEENRTPIVWIAPLFHTDAVTYAIQQSTQL